MLWGKYFSYLQNISSHSLNRLLSIIHLISILLSCAFYFSYAVETGKEGKYCFAPNKAWCSFSGQVLQSVYLETKTQAAYNAIYRMIIPHCLQVIVQRAMGSNCFTVEKGSATGRAIDTWSLWKPHLCGCCCRKELLWPKDIIWKSANIKPWGQSSRGVRAFPSSCSAAMQRDEPGDSIKIASKGLPGKWWWENGSRAGVEVATACSLCLEETLHFSDFPCCRKNA